MEGLAKWLSDISWPIVSRVLAALGVGTVTYTGLGTAFDGVLSATKGALVGLLPIVVNLFARMGVFDYLSITAGGVVSGFSYMVLKHFALKTGSAS